MRINRKQLFTATTVFGLAVFAANQKASVVTEQARTVRLLARGREGIGSAIQILRTDSSPRLREAAAYLIGESATPEQVRSLVAVLRDPSEQVRRAAIIALEKILNPNAVAIEKGDTAVLDAPAVPPLEAVELCSQIRPLLDDRSPYVRAPAAELAGWLRCSSCANQLRNLLADPVEPVRYYASRAIELLTGQAPTYIDVRNVLGDEVPLVAVPQAVEESESVELGPFLRAAFYEKQGKFSYAGGNPARWQTAARVWWDTRNLHVTARCDDPGARDDGDDTVTVVLQPDANSRRFRFVVRPSGALQRTIEGPRVVSSRDSKEWQFHLEIPIAALGRAGVSAGEMWRANLIRGESHRTPGWGTEFSSWCRYYRDLPAGETLGIWEFRRASPLFAFGPAADNIYTFPFDVDSPTTELHRVLTPADGSKWGRIVAPENLTPGTNYFYAALLSAFPAGEPVVLTIVGKDSADHSRVLATKKTVLSRSSSEIRFEIPTSISARSIDLEISVSSGKDKPAVFRSEIPFVPVVAPPVNVQELKLAIVDDQSGRWKLRSAEDAWTVQDVGPMLLTESYPTALLYDGAHTVYGGTYPGGRFFSYDTAAGKVEDLGSPAIPHNHLHDLVASRDGTIFGGINRPRGELFSYRARDGRTINHGVPVPGSFSGRCAVMCWAAGKVYGIQRGHLFAMDAGTGRFVDKGSFMLNGQRYTPSQIAADRDSNLLGVASNHLFRYVSQTDEIYLSKEPFEGWILNGPDGKLYILRSDGRLFLWQAERNQIAAAGQYPPVPRGEGPQFRFDPYRAVVLTLTSTGDLVVARSGLSDLLQTSLLVARPGSSQFSDLGNPVPGALYLTALSPGPDGTVYGLSTERVYGLGRTPIHLFWSGPRRILH